MGLLTSIIQNHIEEKHRDEDQRKANLRQMYGKIAFDPDPSVSDDHREEARQNLSKLLNPEARKSLLQKAGPLFDHLLGVSRGLPTPDSSQSGAPQSQSGQDSVTLASPPGGGAMTVQNRLPTPGPLQSPGTGTGAFETPLTPEESTSFQTWKAQHAPNDSGEDYDLRGLFKSGQGTDARGHATDEFKKPNHPTFSTESRYSGNGADVGGTWETKNGKTVFNASPANLKYRSPQELKDYFQKYEPDATLVLPKTAASAAASKALPTPATNKPKGYFDVPSIGTNAERAAASRAAEDAEWNSWAERGKKILGPNADPRDLAEYAGSKGTKLPTKPQPGTRRAEQWKLPDGSTVDVDFDSKAGHRYDAKGEEWDVPEGATRVGKPVNMQLEYASYPDDKPGDAPHAIRVDPRDPAKRLDADTGKPVPEGAKQVDQQLLVAKVRQQSYSQASKYAAAYELAGYPHDQAEKLGGEKAIEEMDKRIALIGAGHYRDAIAENALGDPGTIRLNSGPVPNAVPAIPPPASQAAPAQALPPAPGPGAASPSAVPATAPQVPSVIPPAGPAKPAAAPVASGSGFRPIEAFSPAQGRAFRDKLIPIRAGATQIFGGDPSHPEMKGIFQYSDLAENQQSKDRIGKVLRLTFDGLADATGHANVAVGAGPVSISTGGIGKFLENYFGVAPAVAEQQSKIMQDAISKLTPREQEYVNTVMSSFGTMVGLRSMTKASAAQGSIEKIERELPLIGINVTNKRSFADKHQKLAEEFFNGLQGLPPQAMKTAAPGLMERIQAVPKEMQDVKDQIDKKLPTPSGQKKEVSQAEVDAYAKKFNLSAADAKKHVEANGFTVK